MFGPPKTQTEAPAQAQAHARAQAQARSAYSRNQWNMYGFMKMIEHPLKNDRLSNNATKTLRFTRETNGILLVWLKTLKYHCNICFVSTWHLF